MVSTVRCWQKALADLNLARRGGLGIAASVVIGATPLLGSLYDAASLQLGYDPITGITLTGFEKAAITAGLAAGLLGGLSFLDEAAEISAKMARHLDNIDVVDVAKAQRGLSHVDDLAGAARAGRVADELTDVAGLGRHADEALDAATSTRLRNLDAFTGGSQATRSADEVRASLRNQSGQGALSRRLNAAAAHRKASNDLNDPSVRYMINRGLGSIQGGSGKFDDVSNIPGSYWHRDNYIYDSGKIEEVYGILEQTDEGRKILSQVRKLERQIPSSQFKLFIAFDPRLKLNEQTKDLGGYAGGMQNKLILNEAFRNVPPELAASTLAHELSHRLRRWESGSLEDEILAHQAGARVWQQLRDRPELLTKLNNLPTNVRTQANLIMDMQNETLRAVLTKSDDELGQWITQKGINYRSLADPDKRYGKSLLAPPGGVSPDPFDYYYHDYWRDRGP